LNPSAWKMLSISSDGRCSPVSAALSWLVATEVSVPPTVSVAIAALISSKPTPAAAAAGATFDMDDDSSANVVFPPLTAVNIESATLWASSALRPKALTTVERPSTAVLTSVVPAMEALEATCRKLRALSFGTPAEMAL